MAGSGSHPTLDDALLASHEAFADLDAAAPERVSPAPPEPERPAEEPSQAEQSQSSALRQRLTSALRALIRSRSTPGFLVSLVLHTGLLLALALITIAGPGRGGFASGILEAFTADADEAVVEMVDPMLASGAETDTAQDSADAESFLASAGTQTITGGEMGAGIQSLARHAATGSAQVAKTTQSVAGQLNGAISSSMNASLAHVGIDGRKPESRRKLALERGGSGESEAAVELALEWLAAHQKPNGSWSLLHNNKQCDAYCSHQGSPEAYEPAATGLALLAFLERGTRIRKASTTRS